MYYTVASVLGTCVLAAATLRGIVSILFFDISNFTMLAENVILLLSENTICLRDVITIIRMYCARTHNAMDLVPRNARKTLLFTI